jgi:hydroxymethylbilane synthase
MLAGRIDIAVHSMKDMPVAQPEGLALDCYLPREDVRDAFVSPHAGGLADLAAGTRGRHLEPAAQGAASQPAPRPRGRRVSRQRADPAEEAGRGRGRLHLPGDGRAEPAGHDPCRPRDHRARRDAAGGGARRHRDRTAGRRCPRGRTARGDSRRPDGARLAAERAFLAALDGSCETPIAGLAELDGGTLRLRGEILRTDGSEALADDQTGAVEDGPEMARAMAAGLLASRGRRVLRLALRRAQIAELCPSLAA